MRPLQCLKFEKKTTPPICCSGGKLVLQRLKVEPPQLVLQMLYGENEFYQHFFTKIGIYKSGFVLTSKVIVEQPGYQRFTQLI